MPSRRAPLILSTLTLTTLWIGFCLYWPFIARQQDIHRAMVEANAAYAVCLHQHALTPAECRADRDAFQNVLRQAAASPHENAYQRFAGRRTRDAIEFVAALCLVPPLLLFALGFLSLQLTLRLIRFRSDTTKLTVRDSRIAAAKRP